MPKSNICVVCMQPIDHADVVIGAGTGKGADYAHHVCYLSREVKRLTRAIAFAKEALADSPDIVSRITRIAAGETP